MVSVASTPLAKGYARLNKTSTWMGEHLGRPCSLG